MHGQMAQAALAWTSGFVFFSNDHSSLTPSNLSIIIILSGSIAHAPTAKKKILKTFPKKCHTFSDIDKERLIGSSQKLN